MALPTDSSRKLAQRIQAAIEDHELTQREYDEILAIVHEDHVIDPQEKALMGELMHLLENGSVKLVAR